LRGALRREGIRAVAFIPLVSRGRLLGKFMVYYNAPHAYAASEVQLAQIIAGHVAFAIEQKRAAQVLQDSEECFSTAFKANPDPMAIHAIRDGRFVEVNDSFLRISGYTRDEVVGHTIADLGFLADPSYFDRAARLLAEQGRLKEFEFEYCTRAGQRRWGLMSAEIIQIGGEPYILSTTSDITARKQIEETTRLHRSVEEQLSLLIDASGVLLTSLDPEAVLKAVLDLSRRLVPADAYAVWRYRESAGRWEMGCAEGLSETYQQVTIDALGAIPGSNHYQPGRRARPVARKPLRSIQGRRHSLAVRRAAAPVRRERWHHRLLLQRPASLHAGRDAHHHGAGQSGVGGDDDCRVVPRAAPLARPGRRVEPFER
jgi:PAS domain S-box-containing protein